MVNDERQLPEEQRIRNQQAEALAALGKRKGDARPLTPPEVRDLLAACEKLNFEPKATGWTARRPGDIALATAFDIDPRIRATLERYAELAEGAGE